MVKKSFSNFLSMGSLPFRETGSYRSLLLIGVLLAGSGGKSSYAAAILFDNSKAEQAGNADWVIDDNAPDPLPAAPSNDTSWTGAISSLGYELSLQGHTLKTLGPGGTITFGSGGPLDLANYQLFVIPEPNVRFSAGEIEAILNFTRNGGGLFLIADHSTSDRNNDGWDSPEIFNDLNTAATFGFAFEANTANDRDWFSEQNTEMYADAADPVLHGPYGDVSLIGLYGATTMILRPGANPSARALAWRNGHAGGLDWVTMVRSQYGAGRVVAIVDSSPVDDGSGTPANTLYDGWNEGSSRQFHLNACAWLLDNGGGPTMTPSPTGTTSPTLTPTLSPTAMPTPEFGLVINEVMPDPDTDWSGNGSFDIRGDEWIELYNASASDLNISGYRVADSQGQFRIQFHGEVLRAGCWRVIYGDEAELFLGNSADSVVLAAPNGTIIDQYTYTSSANDMSHRRAADGGRIWGSSSSCAAPGGGASCANPGTSNDGTGVCGASATWTPTPPPALTPSPTPAHFVTIGFDAGWRPFALPIDPGSGFTLRSLDAAMGSNILLAAALWGPAGWTMYLPDRSPSQSLNLSQGVLLRLSSAGTFTLRGNEIVISQPISLDSGWNLVGVSGPAAWTAASYVARLNSAGVGAMYLAEYDSGAWNVYAPGFPGNDFTLERDKGYFVFCGSGGSVTP